MHDVNTLIFIIGAGRSGTTWLHLMMGSHPRVATGQESQVFSEYIAPLNKRWEDELAWPETEGVRKHGITSYLSQERFVGLLRHFVLEVLGSVLVEKPGATHLLEKSPSSSYHVELIHRCIPEARFIHVVRDGRDVASSMLKAGPGWGRSWAPTRVEDAVGQWKAAVEAARAAASLTPHYTEVRYEDLLSDGVAELRRLFAFIGLSLTVEEASDIYETFGFDRLKSGEYQRDVFKNPGEVSASGTAQRKEPDGFFRKGRAGTWREELSAGEVRSLMWVAGDLLEELGYVDPEDPQSPTRAPAGLVLRGMLRRLRARMAMMGKRMLGVN